MPQFFEISFGRPSNGYFQGGFVSEISTLTADARATSSRPSSYCTGVNVEYPCWGIATPNDLSLKSRKWRGGASRSSTSSRLVDPVRGGVVGNLTAEGAAKHIRG